MPIYPISPVGERDSAVTMWQLWRQSMHTNPANWRQNTSPIQHQQAQLQRDQQVRTGQVECVTCSSRTYVDESGDGGVSFQAPRHIAASTAAAAVANHEGEHVSAQSTAARQQGSQVISSTVSVQHSRCPECGRSYVSGGLTRTTVQATATPQEKSAASQRGRLDTKV